MNDTYLLWNLKDSFRRYVAAMGGEIRTTNGAVEAPGVFAFPLGSSEGEELRFDGSVVFSAHAGALEVRIASPRIRFEGDAATVSVDHGVGGTPGEQRVDLATIRDTDQKALLAGRAAHTALATEGRVVFDFIYDGGTELAPILVSKAPAPE